MNQASDCPALDEERFPALETARVPVLDQPPLDSGSSGSFVAIQLPAARFKESVLPRANRGLRRIARPASSKPFVSPPPRGLFFFASPVKRAYSHIVAGKA